MKIDGILLLCLLALYSCNNGPEVAMNSSDVSKEMNWLAKGLSVAKVQLQKASEEYDPNLNPRSIWPDHEIRTANLRDWTVGFFPGSLWLMYDITDDPFFRNKANLFTVALDSVQHYTYTHDLGFMLNCSYGNGYRLTADENYKKVLLTGAKSLASRFSEKVGSIKSWDFGDFDFPVIIDNMMNLELLLWVSKQTGDNYYKTIALSHADKTLENHFRKDNSSYHVVDYDSETGSVLRRMTHQGYSDESIWARGQAWGLYGFTMMYRETKKEEYLEQAIKIADLILGHPKLPKDKIPYWDFDAPYIPHAYRDVSAATITASALLELSKFTGNDKPYFSSAEEILKNLSSDFYMSDPGENGFFILKHSVGSLPNYSEIDTPINYADYYYLEAILRYAEISQINLSELLKSTEKLNN